MYYLNDLLSEIMLESPMISNNSENKKINFDRKMDIINHWVDLPADVKNQLGFTPEDIAEEYYQKYKYKLKATKISKKFLNLSDKFVETNDREYNLHFHFYNLNRSFTSDQFASNTFNDIAIRGKLKLLLMEPVKSFDDIKKIYQGLNDLSKKYNLDHDELRYLLFDFLDYKLGTLEAQMNMTLNVESISGGLQYHRIILSCIGGVYHNKSLIHYRIDDLSALICLFLKELRIDMNEDGFDTIFYNYFSQPVNTMVRERLIKLKDEDIIDLLDKVTLRDFGKPISSKFKFSFDNKNKQFVDNNYNDFVSEEKLGEYLIFGPNIFKDDSDIQDESTIYEIIYKAYSFTPEDVIGIIGYLVEGSEVTSMLESDDKIFLKLTQDLQIMDIKRKSDGQMLTLMKYKDCNDIFVTYKEIYSKCIYGISCFNGTEEYITIPHNDESKYKFIYGKD